MTVSGEFEADIVRERLAEAGIQVLIQGEGNPRAIASGARDICVEDDELERAREVLKAAEGVSEAELAALSEADEPVEAGEDEAPPHGDPLAG